MNHGLANSEKKRTGDGMTDRLFTKDNFARLTPSERRDLMYMQMAPRLRRHSAYLPDDCGECNNCGDTMFGSGFCSRCYERFEFLIKKATGG